MSSEIEWNEGVRRENVETFVDTFSQSFFLIKKSINYSPIPCAKLNLNTGIWVPRRLK